MGNDYYILPDRSGHVNTGNPEFPIFVVECVSKAMTDSIKRYITSSHWHNDLEIVYYIAGEMDYVVNGASVHIKAGQALFINSCRMHCCTLDNKKCKYITVRINPSIFTNNINSGMSYFDRKFGPGGLDYMLLDSSIEWQEKVILRVLELYERQSKLLERPLTSISLGLYILELIGDHMPDHQRVPNNSKDYSDFTHMIQYVHEHMAEKILIEDIANAGHVSRAKAYTLFYSYANESPNVYLMNYRLDKSLTLLRDTNLSIAEIATMCGFRTASYFTSVFRKEKGMTPREYRAQYK